VGIVPVARIGGSGADVGRPERLISGKSGRNVFLVFISVAAIGIDLMMRMFREMGS
jgi:hypothetical protein